jgi:hypothetical protein
MKNKLYIANMYRAKNKTSFFALHQAITKLPEFNIEFHIIWDDPDYYDEWTDKINDLDCNLISYTKEQLDQYCLDKGINQEIIDKFTNFKAIYFLLHGHYLRDNKITDYYLIYDDDIVLQDDLDELKTCLRDKTPCLISEPMNANCDKSIAGKLINLYEGGIEYYKNCNPHLLGFNAGFQGISLEMYDDFMSKDMFEFLLNLFDYSGIYDANGEEITGPQRSIIDTQQQSFFSTMNILRSSKRPHILDPQLYFVCPNWGVHPTFGELNPENEYGGWDINMKSKIIHFIGHTVFRGKYYGKPKIFHNLVDKYLKKHNLI